MKRVLIFGGGFAGLAAARALRAVGPRVERWVIDPGSGQAFLPMLPDVVGLGYPTRRLLWPFDEAAVRLGFRHVRAAVQTIDPDAGCVVLTDGQRVGYDVLIVASGARTTFHEHEAWRPSALTLDNLADARRLRIAASTGLPQHFVVAGAGYTGVEIATHVARRARRHGWRGQLVLVDPGRMPCRGLPETFQRYILGELERQRLEFVPEARIAEVEGQTVRLTNGRTFEKARLIWTAGVATPPAVRGLALAQNAQGRLQVAPDLRAATNVFAAGDAAAHVFRGQTLRMSVPFALAEGATAGRNAIRLLAGQATRPCRPFDPGYVVPMAGGRGCGLVLGQALHGVLPVALHYLVCCYRAANARNRLAVLQGVWGSLFTAARASADS